MPHTTPTDPTTIKIADPAERALEGFMASAPLSTYGLPPVPPPPARPSTAPAVPIPAPVTRIEASPQLEHSVYAKVAADNTMPDLGVLNGLLADHSVHDILVNGTKSIFVDRGGILVDTNLRFGSDDEVWEVAERILKAVDQQWIAERPMVDTRLPDGSRVNIVAPPMAVDGVMISIRKFPLAGVTLEGMVSKGQISPEFSKFLMLCTANRQNIIISGGTSSGKTTLLNALSSAISPAERIVTIEDSAELRLQQPHVVRLEAKPMIDPSQPHSAVTIRDLMRNALRMRPDRIILGECRGAEAFDVLQAMNTGHEGSMTSLHANTPRDALSRLETMVSIGMPNLTTRVIRQQIASAVHLIIQTDRAKDGIRRITHVSEVSGVEGEIITMQDLVMFTPPTVKQPGGYRWVGGASRNAVVTEAARASGMLSQLR